MNLKANKSVEPVGSWLSTGEAGDTRAKSRGEPQFLFKLLPKPFASREKPLVLEMFRYF